MQLSVIIVSYNVRCFLEQCLCAVTKAANAAGKNSVEILVVDNASSDDTIDQLQSRFPGINLIINKENKGFAKANNQALRLAKGKYVLFLNPDTIIPENAFTGSLEFFDQHPDAGAMGVYMVNGKGIYLKESKRGFPTPWAAFCRLSGLSFLFPKSKIFARYYLGHLSPKNSHEVEALSGAFMMCRKDILLELGGFDERFFMYAEDIDLSYRIREQGSKNYYNAGITIIHFKGESTAKDTRYLKIFYGAMSQFVEKHYKNKRSGFTIAILNAAIRIRSGLATVIRLFQSAKAPKISSHKILRARLMGDPVSIHELEKLVLDAQDSDIRVYCEGPSFSFSDIISSIQKKGRFGKSFIHASGSQSMVSGSGGEDGNNTVRLQ